MKKTERGVQGENIEKMGLKLTTGRQKAKYIRKIYEKLETLSENPEKSWSEIIKMKVIESTHTKSNTSTGMLKIMISMKN